MTTRLWLYGIFVLSGAAGLIYESVWARYLGLFVGHNAYAQVLVITIFLGGMALGAWLVGSRSERLADPLKWYAGVEVLVGAISLFFHEIYQFVTAIAYDTLFPVLAGGPGLTIVKWAIAGLLILPQSVLLGTTFPLMGAGVLRRFGERPGRVLALLYFANSFGAAVGVLVAGFYLLAIAGLPGTLLAGAMVNLLVALVAYVLATRTTATADTALAVARPTESVASTGVLGTSAVLGGERLRWLLLGVSFGTAVASFTYEIAWLRMLALVLGSATHAFELMLSAFILGLALGAFWVRTRADRWSDPLRALAVVQWIMGFTALLTIPLYTESFGLVEWLQSTFARSESGYAAYNVGRYALCMFIMLPSTFCAGVTLPLITRTLLVREMGERAIGSVYSINTLGSITGVCLAGLILMPLMGLRLMLVTGAALDMALGAFILLAASWSGAARRPATVAVAATAIAVLAGTFGTDFARHFVASGVFRFGQLFDADDITIHAYRDGRTATVTVWQLRGSDRITISTNGKADGSFPAPWRGACTDTVPRVPVEGDIATQTLVALVTLAHRPDAREAAVIGHGTGLTGHYLLASPTIERLSNIEIEPEMVRGSRVYYPANRRVFDDPRSSMVIDDARTFMAATPRRFDLLVSEPSNPWVSGVSGLFTSEFYAHAARHLSDDGVFGQWLSLYDISDGLVLSVLAAVHRHFGSYEIFQTSGGDMVIVASKSPLRTPEWSVFALPALREDFCFTVPITPEALEATRLAHRAALAPLLDGWDEPNSDYYPVLDLFAERARFLGETAFSITGLTAQGFDFTAPFFNRRSGPEPEGAIGIGGIPRVSAQAIASALRDPTTISGVDSAALPRGLPGARYRQAQWRALVTGGSAPSDWAIWIDNYRLVVGDLHDGTSGYVDEGFFRDAERYATRHGAPPLIHRILAFDRAVASWNFPAAARLADTLAAAVTEGTRLISADQLVDGAIAAKLLVGDAAGATRLLDTLGPRRRRRVSDVRRQLLDAYVAAFEQPENSGNRPTTTP